MPAFLNKRTRARVQAMQLLHQASFSERDVVDIIATNEFVLEEPLDKRANDLAVNVQSQIDSINRIIASVSDNWDISRINRVDRSILQVAIYEMFCEAELPEAVAISEAVEISKVYGTDDSSLFINGILGKVSKLRQENPSMNLFELSHSFGDDDIHIAIDEYVDDLEDLEDIDPSISADPYVESSTISQE